MSLVIDTDLLYASSCQAVRDAGSDGSYTDVLSLCYERSSVHEFNIPEVVALRQNKSLDNQTPSIIERPEDASRG